MNKNHGFCRLTLKLVEDLPGVHWYVHTCLDCQREYGPEFAVAHSSAGLRSDPIPDVVPDLCNLGFAGLPLPSGSIDFALCAAG